MNNNTERTRLDVWYDTNHIPIDGEFDMSNIKFACSRFLEACVNKRTKLINVNDDMIDLLNNTGYKFLIK